MPAAAAAVLTKGKQWGLHIARTLYSNKLAMLIARFRPLHHKPLNNGFSCAVPAVLRLLLARAAAHGCMSKMQTAQSEAASCDQQVITQLLRDPHQILACPSLPAEELPAQQSLLERLAGDIQTCVDCDCVYSPRCNALRKQKGGAMVLDLYLPANILQASYGLLLLASWPGQAIPSPAQQCLAGVCTAVS